MAPEQHGGTLEQRRSRNPLKNMMQHLSVDAANDIHHSQQQQQQQQHRRQSHSHPGDAASSSNDGSTTPTKSPTAPTSRRQSLMRRLSRRSSRSSPSSKAAAAAAAAEANAYYPYAQSSPSSSRPGTSAGAGAGTGKDPALCQPCASWAADEVATFSEADAVLASSVAADSVTAAVTGMLDKNEYFVTKLPGLEENRWATKCPLCKLFYTARVPSEGVGEYVLAGFSSRDTNYLIDTVKLASAEDHPAKRRDVTVSPVFLGVVPKKKGQGALGWDVQAEWFRGAHMLFRTAPTDRPGHRKDKRTERSRSKNRNEGRLTPEPHTSQMSTLQPQQSSSLTISGSRPSSPVPASSTVADVMSRGTWGREIGQTIDMGVAREWLRYCEMNHQGRCGRHLPAGVQMQGFRLLDCSKSPAQVVEAPFTEHYAALSYVWGGNTEERWPQVFRDAVTVTRQLGLRYLWIDKFCLSDSLPREKMQQVARMDEIYEGAVVTIIAAHGDGATAGLPGVPSAFDMSGGGGAETATRRTEQPKYRFANSDITIVSSLRDPRLLVKESTWYTRGWTYQEGLLARRRLVFTEEQMYWECEGMVCPETLVLPLDFYHDQAPAPVTFTDNGEFGSGARRDQRQGQYYRDQRMCDFMRPGLFNGVSYVDGSWEVWRSRRDAASTLGIFREVDQHIRDYTRRSLTADEDSLGAFLGIQRRLEKTLGSGKLGNVVGVPLWAPQFPPRQQQPPMSGISSSGGDANMNGSMARKSPVPASRPRTKDLFAMATSFWHHKSDGQQPIRRRPHLPSWTWAGWSGEIELTSSITITHPDAPPLPPHTSSHPNDHTITSNTTPAAPAAGEAAAAASKPSERKFHNHHYVRATHLSRNDPSSLRWTYSPDIFLLNPDGSVAWDFDVSGQPGRFGASEGGPPYFPPDRYALLVRNPFVLDKVKARTLPGGGGWMFNDISVDVRLSNLSSGGGAAGAPFSQGREQSGGGGGGSGVAPSIRSYIEQHARGTQITVLWFIEEVTVMLLVLERKGSAWERVGRMRMGFWGEKAEVLKRYGRGRDLEGLVESLPLRRLGEDVIII